MIKVSSIWRELTFQEYNHPVYELVNAWVSAFASSIDLLFNQGKLITYPGEQKVNITPTNEESLKRHLSQHNY